MNGVGDSGNTKARPKAMLEFFKAAVLKPGVYMADFSCYYNLLPLFCKEIWAQIIVSVRLFTRNNTKQLLYFHET